MEIKCENCLHNGVCYVRETTNNINAQLDDFGCNDYLPTKGYRKSSDVAREIFEEADKIFMANCLSLETYGAWLELKKKYVGKDTNVTTNTESEDTE